MSRPNMPLRPLAVPALLLLSVIPQPAAAQRRTIAPAAIARAVDSLAQRVVSARLTPALGVAVVVDGRTVLARSYGFAEATQRIPADDRTLWYVASTSKSFTAFGAALLAHQGAISFDAPIAKTVPQARWSSSVDPNRLTLAHFLSHTHNLNDNAVVLTSSFTGAFPESEWPALVRFAQPTGRSDLVYSNFGYNITAMAIDAARREGWRRFVDSAVFQPAGMRETYARLSGLDTRRIAKPHDLRPDGSFMAIPFAKADATMSPAGGHVATMSDLARWTILHMDGGVIDGRRVFPAEVVALSHKLIAPHTVAASRRFSFFDREGWAAGWDIGTYEGEPMISRFGAYSSTRSHLSFLPRRRIGVVAQSNGRPGYNATDLIAAFAYDLEAGRPNARARAEERFQALVTARAAAQQRAAVDDSSRAARQVPLPRPMAEYAGSYFNESSGTITFEARDNRLFYRWGVLNAAAEVFDAARHQLRINVGGNQVATFTFPAAGPAAAVQVMGETFTRVGGGRAPAGAGRGAARRSFLIRLATR